MAEITYKLDIFATLDQINHKRPFFYENLTEEERKGFLPVVVMRWLSGTSSPLQVILLNEVVNPFVFSLVNHKDLLYKLMTVCAVKPQRYRWLKAGGRKHPHKHSIEVIKRHYQYSTQQASDVFSLLSNEDIVGFAEQQGLQKEDLTKIKTELKDR